MSRTRRWIWRIAVSIIACAAIALAWLAPFDDSAEQMVDAGLERAFVSYAAARTLNGAISVAQGTEVTLGIGASTTLSVGEILDPINDAVESFSDLMLLATISFGIQKMLLVIGSHWAVNASLTAVILIALGLTYSSRGVPDVIRGMLVLLLVARFAVSLATAGSEAIFIVFLQEPYDESSQVIGAETAKISAIQSDASTMSESQAQAEQAAQAQEATDEKPGFFGSLREKMKDIFGRLNPFNAYNSLKEKITELKQTAEQLAKELVNLAVVFLLQTLVFPLLFLWAIYYIVRSAIGPRVAQHLPPPNQWPANLKHKLSPRVHQREMASTPS